MSKVGGMLADIFDPVDRAIAVAIFAARTFIGPVAGPVVGGFITMSYLGWRWTEYITAIMAFFFGTIFFFFVSETFEPVLLQQWAKRLRFETQNWALHAKSEGKPADLKVIARDYLLRPFLMVVLEPILVLVTLYMGFIYGFLYLCFEAYPISFQEERGWNMGVGELPFTAVTVGVICGCAIIIFLHQGALSACSEQNGNGDSRGTLDSDDDRGPSLAGRYVLVRMDIESAYHLGAAGDIGGISGGWRVIDFLAGELTRPFGFNGC